MTSTFDVLRNTIINSQLNQSQKETYLKQLDTTTNTTTNIDTTPIIRNIIADPIINSTMANIGFNPNSIMRDTYNPGFSFKKPIQENNYSSVNIQGQKPVDKQNIKNAVIITKEQATGPNNYGQPEIIKSSIQIVRKANKFNKFNDKKIPLNQQQAFIYSDETPLLDEKLVNRRIPFSKKIVP